MNIRISLPLESWVCILEALEVGIVACGDEISSSKDMIYQREIHSYRTSLQQTSDAIVAGIGDIDIGPRKPPLKSGGKV